MEIYLFCRMFMPLQMMGPVREAARSPKYFGAAYRHRRPPAKKAQAERTTV